MMDKERRRALGALTHELGIGGLDLEMLDVALTHPSYAMEHNSTTTTSGWNFSATRWSI